VTGRLAGNGALAPGAAGNGCAGLGGPAGGTPGAAEPVAIGGIAGGPPAFGGGGRGAAPGMTIGGPPGPLGGPPGPIGGPPIGSGLIGGRGGPPIIGGCAVIDIGAPCAAASAASRWAICGLAPCGGFIPPTRAGSGNGGAVRAVAGGPEPNAMRLSFLVKEFRAVANRWGAD
jgi:hypothetical protein